MFYSWKQNSQPITLHNLQLILQFYYSGCNKTITCVCVCVWVIHQNILILSSTEADLVSSNEQVAPSTATPEEQMMTKKENSAADEAQNAAEVDIQQLLQKYGQVQNQFMLMEDTKKRYNKEGFRIRLVSVIVFFFCYL